MDVHSDIFAGYEEKCMIEILHTDIDIVFCVKPVGMDSETGLPNALKEQLGGEIYPLHRLDTPVGGVMAYARNKKSAAAYSGKISENNGFTKSYLAICEGAFEEKSGIMEDLLFKDSRKNKSFVVSRERKGVKKARLAYNVIAECDYEGKMFSLVSVTLFTGRSHQIRVQFSSRKHPLVGDGKYGSKINSPIALFSYGIETDGRVVSAIPEYTYPWDMFDNTVYNLKE